MYYYFRYFIFLCLSFLLWTIPVLFCLIPPIMSPCIKKIPSTEDGKLLAVIGALFLV